MRRSRGFESPEAQPKKPRLTSEPPRGCRSGIETPLMTVTESVHRRCCVASSLRPWRRRDPGRAGLQAWSGRPRTSCRSRAPHRLGSALIPSRTPRLHRPTDALCDDNHDDAPGGGGLDRRQELPVLRGTVARAVGLDDQPCNSGAHVRKNGRREPGEQPHRRNVPERSVVSPEIPRRRARVRSSRLRRYRSRRAAGTGVSRTHRGLRRRPSWPGSP